MRFYHNPNHLHSLVSSIISSKRAQLNFFFFFFAKKSPVELDQVLHYSGRVSGPGHKSTHGFHQAAGINITSIQYYMYLSFCLVTNLLPFVLVKDFTQNSSSELVLYSYWQSSCSWRVRFALNLKGSLFFILDC